MTTIYKAKGTCRYPGCNKIINASEKGYCVDHKKPDYRTKLDNGRAPGSAKFYGSWAWKKTRKAYKIQYPFCERCKKEKGIVVPGHTVHHTTERTELEKNGLSPHDFTFLENVCFNCHQKELRKRRRKDG